MELLLHTSQSPCSTLGRRRSKQRSRSLLDKEPNVGVFGMLGRDLRTDRQPLRFLARQSPSEHSSSHSPSLHTLHLLSTLMRWYEVLTSTPVLIAGAVGISAAVYARRHTAEQAKEQAREVIDARKAEGVKGKMAQAVSHSDSPGLLHIHPQMENGLIKTSGSLHHVCASGESRSTKGESGRQGKPKVD